MVIISTRKIEVSGETRTFKVKYSSDNTDFSIDIPVYIADVVGCKYVITDKTQSGVEKQLEDILYKFSKTVTKEEKVILFMIDPGLHLHSGRGTIYGQSTETRINPDDITYHHRLSLDMRFYVVVKKTFNQREVYFTMDYDERRGQPLIGGSGSPKAYHGWTCDKEWMTRDKFVEIPWTQEREDFFRAAQVGFVELINKLIEFRNTASADPSKVLSFIDNGGNFGLALPAPKGDKS